MLQRSGTARLRTEAIPRGDRILGKGRSDEPGIKSHKVQRQGLLSQRGHVLLGDPGEYPGRRS